MKNDNNLKKINDLGIILSLLNTAKDNTSEVYVWRIIGSEKHIAQVKIETIRKVRKDFCITTTEGQEKKLEELIGTQSCLDIYIPDSSVLMRCDIKNIDSTKKYYLQIPQYIVQSDRRKSFRVNVYDKSEVKLSFNKSITLMKTMSQSFFKDCFDISAGGFSFFVSKMELKFFQENDPISSIEINTGNWKTKVTAVVSFIREVEPDEFNDFPYKVWRVSCKFTQIDQVGRKYLERFIFERIKEELSVINQ